MTTRRLWLHAETPQAVFVGPTDSHRDSSNRWLPLKLIEITGREPVKRGITPDDPFIMGVMLDFTAPAWLIDREWPGGVQ